MSHGRLHHSKHYVTLTPSFHSENNTFSQNYYELCAFWASLVSKASLLGWSGLITSLVVNWIVSSNICIPFALIVAAFISFPSCVRVCIIISMQWCCVLGRMWKQSKIYGTSLRGCLPIVLTPQFGDGWTSGRQPRQCEIIRVRTNPMPLTRTCRLELKCSGQQSKTRRQKKWWHPQSRPTTSYSTPVDLLSE